MTATPQFMPETPDTASDALSDMLDNMHLTGTVLFRAAFREPWSVMTPDSCRLAQALPFRTEHIIPFHVIASGGCWIEMPDRAPVWLSEGDAVLLPYGDSHRLGGRQATETLPIAELLPSSPWHGIPVFEHGGSGDVASIICGFVECDELLFDPIFRHLPILLHISPGTTAADDWLTSTIRHAADEASKSLPGSRSILPRLTELMFVEILRKHMQELSIEEVGWFAAYNDPVAGAGLKCLHAAPFDDWSVDSLARQVGVSRTVLAERFKYFLDQPPMQYLAHWRLRLAAQNLKSGDLPLKAVAEQAGYESEAAFSRAFKRHFGLPPGDWRRRQIRG